MDHIDIFQNILFCIPHISYNSFEWHEVWFVVYPGGSYILSSSLICVMLFSVPLSFPPCILWDRIQRSLCRRDIHNFSSPKTADNRFHRSCAHIKYSRGLQEHWRSDHTMNSRVPPLKQAMRPPFARLKWCSSSVLTDTDKNTAHHVSLQTPDIWPLVTTAAHKQVTLSEYGTADITLYTKSDMW